MLEKENSPAVGSEAEECSGSDKPVSNPTGPEAQTEKDGTGQASKQGKQESWFPVARRDIAKIRRNYQAAEGDRLIALWCHLVSLANNYKTNAVRQTLAQIGNVMCISKRETVKRALLNLERIRLLKISPAKRGQGGRYEVSVITLKPSSPCFVDSKQPRPINGEPDTVKPKAHHVRSPNAVERVTKNNIQEALKGPPVDIIIEKESIEDDLGASAIAPQSPQDSIEEKGKQPSQPEPKRLQYDDAEVFGTGGAA